MPKLDKTTSEQISPDGNPIPGSSAPAASTVAPAAPVVEAPVTEAQVEALPKEDESKEDESKVDDTIDFTAFLDAKQTVEAPGIAPKVEKPVEPEKPKEPVKVAPSSDTDGRDYTEFSEDEKNLFQRMSNDAFNKLKPVYLEHRRLKVEKEELSKKLEDAQKGITKIPDNYYEHPQAFVLTPEFEVATQRVNQAQAVFDHWTDQLNKVREGAKEVDILGTDAQGNLAVTGKIPADISVETKLLSYFNFAQQQLMNEQAAQRSLAKVHADKYKDSIAFVRDFEHKSFPVFETEDGKKKYDPIIADTINKFPSTFRNNPLTTILAKSLVTSLQLGLLLQQMQNNGGTKKPANPAAKIGPSAEEAAGAGSGKSDTSVSFDDFERVKQGL